MMFAYWKPAQVFNENEVILTRAGSLQSVKHGWTTATVEDEQTTKVRYDVLSEGMGRKTNNYSRCLFGS